MIHLNKNIMANNLLKTFNTKINIKKIKEIIENGRKKEVQELYYSCYCNPKEIYGKEFFEAYNVKLENVIVFEVRYCEKIKYMKGQKNFIIEFDKLQYEVFNLDFKNNSKEIVLIKAKMVN